MYRRKVIVNKNEKRTNDVLDTVVKNTMHFLSKIEGCRCTAN